MSSRSKTNPGGKGRLSLRRFSRARWRLRSRLTSKAFSPATLISMSSPSFSSSDLTTAAGRRTARLFPHFETCIGLLGYTYTIVYLRRLESNNSVHHRPQHHRNRPADDRVAVASQQRHQTHHHRRSHHVEQSPTSTGNHKRPRHLGTRPPQLPGREHSQYRG